MLEPDRLYFFRDNDHLIGVRLDTETPDGGALVTDLSTGRGRSLTQAEVATLEPSMKLTKENENERNDKSV